MGQRYRSGDGGVLIPDRDIDALIERHVFGNEVRKITSLWDDEDYSTTCKPIWDDSYDTLQTISGEVRFGGARRVKRYSTDIAAAWLVVTKMRSLGYGCEICGDLDDCWEVSFWGQNRNSVVEEAGRCPRSICSAALRAVGVKI